MNRQRKWQLKQSAKKQCQICGKGPLETKVLCAACAKIHRDRYRKANGIPLDRPVVHYETDKQRTEAVNTQQRNYYRRKHGIPLCAPLYTRSGKTKGDT